MDKTFPSRMENDILSSNRGIERCRECETCIFNNDGTLYGDKYTKGSCQLFPYPMCKPIEVINNGLCEFKEVDDES